MVSYQVSVIIKCPVQEVFEFVKDPGNSGLWQAGIEDIKPDGPIKRGTKICGYTHQLGKKIPILAEVTEVRDNQLLAYRSISGPITFDLYYRFEADGKGTKLRMHAQADVASLFRLAEPVIAEIGRNRSQNDLENLKTVLESRSL